MRAQPEPPPMHHFYTPFKHILAYLDYTEKYPSAAADKHPIHTCIAMCIEVCLSTLRFNLGSLFDDSFTIQIETSTGSFTSPQLHHPVWKLQTQAIEHQGPFIDFSDTHR